VPDPQQSRGLAPITMVCIMCMYVCMYVCLYHMTYQNPEPYLRFVEFTITCVFIYVIDNYEIMVFFAYSSVTLR
jgi:hypothetical protein